MLEDKELILAKPHSFMNLSGGPVKMLSKEFKVPLENCIILLDHFNLSFGKMKLQTEGSSGGHNGLQNIIQVLNTQKIPRIRIGIDPPPQSMEFVSYVLENFLEDQERHLPLIFNNIVDSLELWIQRGPADVMNKYNNKSFLNTPKRPK
eukprot:TRINITY_DN6984_c0_g1_i2.p1 TRINITY_DN6984_c0_g1~~TRINITY_DN6984_c0_g1_i2.p1  ORF type:complete len:149 (-),score=30.79 TRINITY_DN6984_c0_g1_i2:13-459(-)